MVITVLTALIAMAIPKMKGLTDLSNKAKVLRELKTMQGAIESYYMFSIPSVYPWTSTTLGATYLISATPSQISNAVYDPFAASGTEYNYIKSGTGTTGKYYVVYSKGINRSAGSITISTTGAVGGLDGDDMCLTNGSGCDSLNGCGSHQCTSGQTCCAGACANVAACGATANGAGCASNAACASGFCDTAYFSVCTTGDIGVRCSATNQCQSGYCGSGAVGCSTGLNGVSCSATMGCSSGYCTNASSGNKCTDKAIGSSCSSGTYCLSGYCSQNNGTNVGVCTNGAVGDTCFGSGACCQSGYCDSGTTSKCTTGLTGARCSQNSECASGTCAGTVCI